MFERGWLEWIKEPPSNYVALACMAIVFGVLIWWLVEEIKDYRLATLILEEKMSYADNMKKMVDTLASTRFDLSERLDKDTILLYFMSGDIVQGLDFWSYYEAFTEAYKDCPDEFDGSVFGSI